MSPTIEILATPGCPHAEEATSRARRVVDRLAPDADVLITTVHDAEEAVARAFPGSPTVLIDGVDVAASEAGQPAFACRRYQDGSGVPEEWRIEAGLLRVLDPKHILFLCVANSARSQLAEGIGRRLAPEGVKISSAGSEPSRVRPQAVEVLAEIGIDASAQRSKSVAELADAGVDTVITLCAEENCPVWLGRAHRVHWALPDPAAATGTEQEVLDSFRRVRDEIKRRLEVMFAG